MAENNHKLLVTIGAALGSGFNSVVSGSTSKIKKLGSAIKEMERNSLISASSFQKLKGQYNSLLGSMYRQQSIVQKRGFYRSQIMEVVALGAALAAPIRSAMKFESAMADVGKVVDFSEAEGLQKMGNSLKELSRSIPLSVDGLAQITAAGGQLGVKEKDLISFTTSVAKMSTAFDMLPDEAGKSMATLSNNPELTRTITHVVGGLITARLATFALGYASTFLFGGLNRLVILFKGLRLGIGMLGASFKSFLGWPAALVAGAWLIWENWESVQTFFANIWENVSPAWDAFIQKIKSLSITQKIIDAWESVKNYFKGFFDELTPLWNKFTLPISNLFGGAKNLVSKIGSSLGFGGSKAESSLKLPEMKRMAPEVSREQNNNFAITINAARNDNAELISDKVMKKVSNYSRTFLYDPVPEVL